MKINKLSTILNTGEAMSDWSVRTHGSDVVLLAV